MKKRLLFLSLAFNFVFIGGTVLAIWKIGTPRYLYYLVKHRGQGMTVLKEQRAEMFKTLPIQNQSIVMLGNSITALCEWSELFEKPNIINRGIMGDGTEDILARLPQITNGHPHKIFLLIGVNDLIFHPFPNILSNYETIVTQIRQLTPDSKLYLESVLPIHNSLRRSGLRNEDIIELNQGIQKIAVKYQLPYLDLHRKMIDADGALQANLSKDGIHLNAAGYQIFKELLKKHISE
jgi:lysophospholipase L1-like esterase